MNRLYSVEFLDRRTRKVMRRFDYPKNKVLSKFFWEKMKAEELQKLTKSRMMEQGDIVMRDITDITAQN